MSSSSRNNAELEELRSQLDAYELPEKFQKQSLSGATIDIALLQKYKEARDNYLQRKMMHAVIQQACSTFDGKGFAVPQVPSDEEQEALRERSDQVLKSVQEKSANFQRQLLELQAKHSLFLTRREEFEQMCLLKSNDDNDDGGGDDDDDVSIDENELAAQEEKLSALQKRRAALEVQLKTVQQQNVQAEKAVQAHKAQLESLQKENNNYSFDYAALQNDPEALENLKKENIELQVKLEKVKEIQGFYKNLRLLTEELHGIRIVSVDKAPNNNNNATDNNNMLLKVQLLNKYDVEVVLKTAKRDNMTIVSAKFVSNNTVITGPSSTCSGGDEQGVPPVQLKIPSLDDYVALAANMQLSRPGDNLRFLLRETIARITMVEARVQELTVLQNEVLTRIGKFNDDFNNNSSFGGQDQEVVCSLNHEQMTVVLRLTPDCPMVDGSVYIDQLVGLGGWDAELVEHIKTTINNDNRCKSPVTVVRNLKAEILRLQEEEGLCLPTTPKMPVRGHEW